MSKIIRTVKYERSAFGKFIKFLFIGFNVLMLIWLFSYWGNVGALVNNGSDAERAGAAIGSAFGTGLLFMIWSTGAVVLGIPVLLTKGRRIEIEERMDSTEMSAASEATQEPSTWQGKPLTSVEKIGLWALGLIFLIAGLGTLTNSALAGLAFICISLLLLPPVYTKIRKRDGSQISTGMRVSIIIGLLILAGMSASTSTPVSVQKNTASISSDAASNPTTAQPNGGWDYSSSTDDMSSGEIKTAANLSTNTIDLDFPYGGEQRGTILLRKHPRHGTDVIFRVEKGQINCNSYNGCSLLVRFDDNPPQKFSASEPADHSSETIFLSNYERFIKAAKAAKKITLEVSFFQQGNKVFYFDTENLNWE